MIEQTAAAAGTNNVGVQVIRPDAAAPNGERLVVGNGGTTKTWSSPDIAIRKTGPAQALYHRMWGSGFLPTRHNGVSLRGTGDPVLYLQNPDGVTQEPIELRVGMSADEVNATVAGMLETVPHAAGVNNHEGSRATADA